MTNKKLLIAWAFVAAVGVGGCSSGQGPVGDDVAPEKQTLNNGNGGLWSCALSQFHGQQLWTCDNGQLTRCDANGNAEHVSCGNSGCKSNPAGVEDQCNWSCSASSYHGSQYWTCSNGNLNECGANGPEVTYCNGLGCKSNAAGVDDQCYGGGGGGGGGGTPTNVRAAAGDGYALVRWRANGTAQSGFTITSSPGGIVVHAAPGATAATVGSLTNGVVYSFAVVEDRSSVAWSNPVRPGSDAHVIADVVQHEQTRALTCEEAALVMALSHQGITRTENDVLSVIGIDWTPASWDRNGNLHWGDPNASFVGSPDGDEASLTGYGTYAPPIARAAKAFGGTVVASGQSFTPAAVYEAVLANHPVIAWIATDWTYRPRVSNWITDDGTTIGWYGPHEHAVTIVGVDRDYVVVDNPLHSLEWQRVSKATFEATFQTYGNMAVMLQ